MRYTEENVLIRIILVDLTMIIYPGHFETVFYQLEDNNHQSLNIPLKTSYIHVILNWSIPLVISSP